MTRSHSRAALAAGAVIGAGALLAGPAIAAAPPNYVTTPAVTGVSSLTPESAVLTAAIDTGGDQGLAFTGTPSAPYYFGGQTVTGAGILNGIPTGAGFYSTALLEADPLSDYVASGNQFGGDTITAPAQEVQTSTGLSAVSAEVGGYPAATATGDTLTPGTKYVYEVVQQAGETDQAGTVNEYSASDLANWVNGTGSISADGFSSATAVTSSNDEAAWAAGTGTYAGDPHDPTKIPASTINPDYACVLNSVISANTNSDFTAEAAAKQSPVAAGTTTINGTPVPYGIGSASASTGAITAQSAAQPAYQGSCVTFYGGGGTRFYTSGIGTFTTPKLGTIVVGAKAPVSGRRAAVAITSDSVERGAGTIALVARIKGRTVTIASGRFSVPAGATSQLSYTLSGKALSVLKKKGAHLTAAVTVTSTTDQPSSGRHVTLTQTS